MTDETKQAYGRFIENFMRGNYAECVLEARPLIKTWITLDLLQMYLISLQRLGKPREAEEFGAQVVSEGSNMDPWSRALLGLTFGQGGPDKLMDEMGKLLKQAQDNKQRCQLLYYAGAKFLTFGVKDYAQASFGSATAEQWKELQAIMSKHARGCFVVAEAIDVPCLEQKLAAHALQFLDSGNSLLSGDDTTQ